MTLWLQEEKDKMAKRRYVRKNLNMKMMQFSMKQKFKK